MILGSRRTASASKCRGGLKRRRPIAKCSWSILVFESRLAHEEVLCRGRLQCGGVGRKRGCLPRRRKVLQQCFETSCLRRPGKSPGLASLTLKQSALATPKVRTLMPGGPITFQAGYDDRFCKRRRQSQQHALFFPNGSSLCIHRPSFSRPRKMLDGGILE